MISKQKRGRILWPLVACLPLIACGGSKPVGVKPRPVEAAIERPCRHPSEFLGGNDWEVITGRVGDELILCGKEKAALAQWAAGVSGESYWSRW